MQTNYVVVAILALGIAVLMFQGSGYTSVVGNDPTGGLESGEEVEERAGESAVGNDSEDGFEGSASNANDDNIVGFVIAGGQGIASIAGMVVMLPWELNNLGFPMWFARPAGHGFQLVASVGIIQFVANRVFQ